MRMVVNSLWLQTLGYLGAVACVMVGGFYGMRSVLLTVPKPEFLSPEYQWASHPPSQSDLSEPLPPVVARKYQPSPIPQVNWRGSIVASYSAQAAAPAFKPAAAEKRSKEARKARTSKKRHARKQIRKAMDAYAAQLPWDYR